MSGPIARLAGVSFRYPGAQRDALRDESWEVSPGSLSLIAGASGSGKSTLLRCLNGLVPHFSGGAFGGGVTVAGIDTRTASPRELSPHVGFVFQDPESQMITDRVEDEVAFGMEQLGVERSTMRRRVDWAMARAGITHLAHRRPGELSGGERQRVAIAAALASRPRLLVLDEPSSQLDPAGAAAILEAVADLARDGELAVVIAEHRLDHLLGVAQELKLMADDMASGPLREVAARIDPTPLPQVTRLARALGLAVLPLSLDEARQSFVGRPLPAAPVPASQPAGDTLARLNGVDVELGGRAVLANVSMHVREGELVALMGRNGSGKTTLLRTLAGLQAIRRGGVTTLGLDLRRAHPAELGGRVGYVPQHASTLFHHERLIDELERGGGSRRPTADPMRTLARLGLGAMAERHPLDLSGGERERAALATIMHGQPSLLLLDEPTRGMDAWRKLELAALLDQARHNGAGIVMATHDVGLVARCATRVVVLDDGEVTADGHPRLVLPASAGMTTQVNALFGETWLTVEDVLAAEAASAPLGSTRQIPVGAGQ